MALTFGEFELEVISGGRFRLDGGGMFGVVPKVLWQKKSPPDERNRILMDTNCLLIRGPAGNVIIDSGYGSKNSPRDREFFSLEEGLPLLANLAKAGMKPDQIDCVILTHLHFDHAGGCTVEENGKLRLTFPKARHVVQRAEWEDATGRLPELRGSYFERDFLPLQEAGRIELIEGDAGILPGISVRVTGGHTRGHQVVLLESQGRRAICPADLCPTSAHLKTFWTMGYDQCLVELRRTKAKLIGQAADEGWLVVLSHDPSIRAAYVGRDPANEFVIREVVPV